MVEHQSHPKKMENLNIIIEINEEGEMADFDISLRSELPYKNTDEFEYVVEEFEKVKEVNHKKLRCLLARELNCFACSAIYRFQLIFVRRRRKTPVNNVQYVQIVNQRKVQQPTYHQQTQQQQQTRVATPVTKTVRVIPKVNAAIPTQVATTTTTSITRKQPMVPQTVQRTIAVNELSRSHEVKGREVRTLKLEPTKTIATAQNTVRGRVSATAGPVRRIQQQHQIVQQHHHHPHHQSVHDLGASSEEDIETEVIDSSMVEVQIESSNSPKPHPIATPTTTHQHTKRIKTLPAVAKAEPKDPIETLKSDEDDPLKCDLCNRVFHSMRQCQRHRLEHLEQSQLLNCKKCDKPFLNKSDLVAHERTHSNVRGSRKSGGPTKRKSESEEQVIMEMTVTEEEEVISDGMYVQEV